MSLDNNKISLPLFVFDGNDLSLFPSIEALTTKLEGIDVADGAYEVFDASGHVVNLQAVGASRSGIVVDVGTVLFTGVEDSPNSEKLIERMQSYLLAVGQTAMSESKSLSELVEACKRSEGY